MIRQFTLTEKGHGRIETRSIEVLATHGTDINFPGVKQVAFLTRQREIVKYRKTSSDAVFLITNSDHTKLDAETFLELKRIYWHIENKLHYRKDFVFGEDRSTIRKKYGPQNMATLRNFAIGLLSTNNIGNVKRCVDNLQHDTYAILKNAA